MKRICRKNYYDYSYLDNPNAVLCHRPHKYGNPYVISETCTREEAIEKYRLMLDKKLKDNPDYLKDLIGKDLVCFCKLCEACHTDILIKYVKQIYGE